MKYLIAAVLLVVTTLRPWVADAGVASKGFRELAEWAIKRGGKEAAEETVESLTRKITTLAARHGDDLVTSAFKRVGPRAARLASEAGEHSGVALKLLGRYGDDGIRLASRPTALQLAAQFGDDVAEPILRHGDVAERLIERFGKDGAHALSKLSEQNTRRLAMLVKEHGDKVTPEFVQVFAKHGSADTVAEWVWRNKGSLFVAGGMASFVANPDLFVNAAESVATTTVNSAVKPLAEVPLAVAGEAAARTNWTAVILLTMAGLGGAGWVWISRFRVLSSARQENSTGSRGRRWWQHN